MTGNVLQHMLKKEFVYAFERFDIMETQFFKNEFTSYCHCMLVLAQIP